MKQVQTENKRLLTDKEVDEVRARFPKEAEWGDSFINWTNEAQDAKTLTLVVAGTLKKVGRGLSALGYYEKPEDFLKELEEYFLSHPEEEQAK